ncbi:uncharacterized protein LOC144439062 [Glandiceps talaboti]
MANSDITTVINERTSTIMELYTSGDMKALAQQYTEDCKLMVPGKEIQIGRQAIEDVHIKMKAMGIAKMTLKSQECGGTGDGDTAYDQGSYETIKEDGTVADVGKYLVIWKKVDGVYLLKIDMFSSNKSG